MKKRILFLGLILTVLFAGNSCKKESSKPQSAFTGKYVLISETNLNVSSGVSETYTSTASPCMSDNQTNIKNDGTWASAYAGAEDCYVSRTENSYTTIGEKGSSATGTWLENNGGIKFTLPGKYTQYGKLSNTGGKTQLILRDTTQYFISVSTWAKQ